jgi:hypothetical protein
MGASLSKHNFILNIWISIGLQKLPQKDQENVNFLQKSINLLRIKGLIFYNLLQVCLVLLNQHSQAERGILAFLHQRSGKVRSKGMT